MESNVRRKSLLTEDINSTKLVNLTLTEGELLYIRKTLEIQLRSSKCSKSSALTSQKSTQRYIDNALADPVKYSLWNIKALNKNLEIEKERIDAAEKHVNKIEAALNKIKIALRN